MAMEIRLHTISLWLINILVLINVTIAQNPKPPHLVLMPKELRPNLGDTVYVSCKPEVPNPDAVTNVEWRNPKGEIIQADAEFAERVQTLEGLEGQNQLDLMINKLRKQDVGNYTCSANYAGNQKLVETVQILFQESIDFQDTETLQTPILNSDAKVRCVVSAIPAPLIDWTKDGAPLKPDERHIVQNDGILIKNIQEGDEGVYRCRARVAALGQIDFRDIQVEVHVRPEITLAPKDTEGVEKEAVSFQCVAKGKPAPKYSWVNKDSEVLNGKDGFYVDELTGELKILDLRPDHAGKYRCTAENNAGEVTSEAVLRVLMKPKIEQFINITKTVGSASELRCIISGDPLPEAIFKKEVNPEAFVTGINNDDRIEVRQETDDQGRRLGVLRFTELQRSDDGLYSCKGTSTGGESEGWGHITVEFAPTFEDQPLDDFWSWEQKPVNLSCLATSIPNATIQWFQRENVPIRETDQNLKIMARGPNGILRVTPLDGSYFDTYTCKATNEHGEKSHEVTLKQVQKPGPVSSTQVVKSTATTVSWSIRDPLDDGGRPVIGYSAQFRLAENGWDKDVQFKYWTKGSEQNYLVDKLTPLAKYVFRFAAKNEVGEGEWSGDKSVEMPKRSSPEEPLIFGINNNEVKKIPYTDHYELQWQVPLDNGEDIDYFQIIYYTVKESNEGGWDKTSSKPMTIEVKYPGKSSFKLENLQSDSYYKIELRAHNKIGYSTPSEAIIKTAYASEDPVAQASRGANAGIIVAVVIVVLLILLVILDVICFFCKDVGVTATIFKKVAAKPNDKDKEAMLEEGVKESVENNDNEKSKLTEETPVKETEPTETTPMIVGGESDKDAIIKEENEQKKQDVNGHDAPEIVEEIKKSESKGSITKDSSV